MANTNHILSQDDKYKAFEKNRDKYSNIIVKSTVDKKIIVSGPGTGKSYIFKRICDENIKQGKSNILTLSFINELVDDLTIDLLNKSEVKTLHSFALSIIRGADKYHTNLENIIKKDYEYLFGKTVDFNDLLCNLGSNQNLIGFFFDRRKYYEVYSPNSSVYSLVRYFQDHKNKIPSYSQILIDEYQDFNKLESTLIDLLAEKSPILIVGDDDQSLYGWKYANPDEIRKKANSAEYTSFKLPYCSRCPEVINKAFKCIVKKANENNLLKKRISKPFEYFPSANTDLISRKYPKITLRNVFPGSEAFFIDQEIKKCINPKNENGETVLIICPFKKQVFNLEKQLQNKGYRNILTRNSNDTNQLLEGFNFLLDDSSSNLGWRIASENILSQQEFEQVLSNNYQDKTGSKFYSFVPSNTRGKIRSLLCSLRKVKKCQPVNKEEIEEILKYLKYDPLKISLGKVKKELNLSTTVKNTHKNIHIKITTIQGSKGLDGNFVFLTNFDDRYIFEKGKSLTDEVISRFLVTLTRTRNRLNIYSSQKTIPTLLTWLDRNLYQIVGQ